MMENETIVTYWLLSLWSAELLIIESDWEKYNDKKERRTPMLSHLTHICYQLNCVCSPNQVDVVPSKKRKEIWITYWKKNLCVDPQIKTEKEETEALWISRASRGKISTKKWEIFVNKKKKIIKQWNETYCHWQNILFFFIRRL